MRQTLFGHSTFSVFPVAALKGVASLFTLLATASACAYSFGLLQVGRWEEEGGGGRCCLTTSYLLASVILPTYYNLLASYLQHLLTTRMLTSRSLLAYSSLTYLSLLLKHYLLAAYLLATLPTS